MPHKSNPVKRCICSNKQRKGLFSESRRHDRRRWLEALSEIGDSKSPYPAARRVRMTVLGWVLRAPSGFGAHSLQEMLDLLLTGSWITSAIAIGPICGSIQ